MHWQKFGDSPTVGDALMSSPDPDLAQCATAAAEEVLRTIYGDDLQGCAVRLDAVTEAILEPFRARAAEQRELLGLYDKAFEALNLLATPPAGGETLSPDALRSLLGERLDAIRSLTQKLIETTATLRGAGNDGGVGLDGGQDVS
jgi:hypothetical protein